jgi:hypothetical protein
MFRFLMRYYILFCQHYYYQEWLLLLLQFCIGGTVQIRNGTHFNTSLNTVISTVNRQRAERLRNNGSIPAKSNKLFSFLKVKPALGPTQALMGAFSLRVGRAGREVDHSSPSAEVKNEWSCTSASSECFHSL